MDALVNVAVPVFGLVLTGWLAGRLGVLGEASAVALNRFVYFFALPALLFAFTARAPLARTLNWPFLGAFLGGVAISLVVALAADRLWFRNPPAEAALAGLSAVFANTAYMGVPLLLTAYGAGGALPAIVATLATTTLLIGGTIAFIEALRAEGPSLGRIIRQVAAVIVRNPLLVAPFLGIAVAGSGLALPKPASNYLDLLAAAAGPAALFALGLSLVGRRLAGNASEIAWLTGLKLLVHPAATWLLVTYVFTLDRQWATAAVVLAALPVGALVFVVAQQYDVYVERASAAVVATTALSVVTVSLLLILLGVG